MKIHVDENRCQGVGMCVAIAPEVFGLRPDGIAEVLVDEIGPELSALAEEAVSACPTAALSIVEGSNG